MLTLNKYFDEYKFVVNYHDKFDTYYSMTHCLVRTWKDGYDLLKSKYSNDTDLTFTIPTKTFKTQLIVEKDIKEDSEVYAIIKNDISGHSDILYLIKRIEDSSKLFYSKSMSKILINNPVTNRGSDSGFTYKDRIGVFKTWKDAEFDAIYFQTYALSPKSFVSFLERNVIEDIDMYKDMFENENSFNIEKNKLKESEKYLDYGVVYYNVNSLHNYNDSFINFIGIIFLYC